MRALNRRLLPWLCVSAALHWVAWYILAAIPWQHFQGKPTLVADLIARPCEPLYDALAVAVLVGVATPLVLVAWLDHGHEERHSLAGLGAVLLAFAGLHELFLVARRMGSPDFFAPASDLQAIRVGQALLVGAAIAALVAVLERQLRSARRGVVLGGIAGATAASWALILQMTLVPRFHEPPLPDPEGPVLASTDLVEQCSDIYLWADSRPSVVAVLSDGGLVVDGEPVSAEGLAATLARVAGGMETRHDEIVRADFPDEVLSLRIDLDAPWKSVEAILRACADVRIWKLWIEVRTSAPPYRSKYWVYLPMDTEFSNRPDPNPVVQVAAGEEPTYSVDGGPAVRAIDAAPLLVRGEGARFRLRTEGDVRWRHVLSLFEQAQRVRPGCYVQLQPPYGG